MDRTTDAAAIRRSLTEPRAFAAVFDRHYASVHGYAARRVGLDLGDEIAAETFTIAFDRRTRYDLGYDDARPWLLAIATNLLRRHWRTERRRIAALARTHAPAPAAAPVPGGLPPELVGALDAIAPADREALLLYALGELSYEEIARALDRPVGTVRSRIARARRLLRDRLVDDPAAHLSTPESSHV